MNMLTQVQTILINVSRKTPNQIILLDNVMLCFN